MAYCIKTQVKICEKIQKMQKMHKKSYLYCELYVII
jgi:hypothetical protein